MKIALFWHRRDLRLHDNTGLYHALRGAYPVLPFFIFDRRILDELDDQDDRRVSFIHQHLQRLQDALSEQGSTMLVRYGDPLEVWKAVLEEYEVAAVYTNRDYEPYAKARDQEIEKLLEARNVPFHTHKDQCLREKDEVLKDDGDPYVVFTPYAKKWRKTAPDDLFMAFDTAPYFGNFYQTETLPLIRLDQMGFTENTNLDFPDRDFSEQTIRAYQDKRNLPAEQGTTRLSVHLRFGTISIRWLARETQDISSTFLNELIWRDFYMTILDHFPHVAERSFRPEYDYIEWRNDESEFAAWCAGQTGYPIVDAGMRELNQSGYMHNRVRMIVASFLTKHLLIDWRWGERYFARKLLDFELSSNNGGWQWAAGSGCDAAPYFRIFNPYSQTKKFDPGMHYIKKWVPEYGDFSYPQPIVEHKAARQRALDTYKAGLKHGKMRIGK